MKRCKPNFHVWGRCKIRESSKWTAENTVFICRVCGLKGKL